MKIEKFDIKALAIGIIGSLLVIYLLVPGLNIIGKLVFILSSVFFEKYNNLLYQRIALRDYNLDVYIYLYIFVFYLVIFISVLIKFHFDIKRILRDYDDLEKRASKYETSNNEKTEDDEEICNELKEVKKTIELGRKNIKKNYFFSKIQILIAFLIFFIIGLVNLSTETTIRSKVQLFENSLRIISPHISNHEIRILESKFVQIRNKNDYELIREQMNNMLIEKGLMIIWQ
jgi:hypothetical protein